MKVKQNHTDRQWGSIQGGADKILTLPLHHLLDTAASTK